MLFPSQEYENKIGTLHATYEDRRQELEQNIEKARAERQEADRSLRKLGISQNDVHKAYRPLAAVLEKELQETEALQTASESRPYNTL